MLCLPYILGCPILHPVALLAYQEFLIFSLRRKFGHQNGEIWCGQNLVQILKFHGEIWCNFVVPNFAIPNLAYSNPPPPPPPPPPPRVVHPCIYRIRFALPAECVDLISALIVLHVA